MGRTLSPLETVLWRAGHDPTMRMAVGNLVLLDRLPDVDALVARLDRAAEAVPRLRWRIDDPSRTRVRPGWVDDPDFDPRDHVRVLAVAAPGDMRQLLDLVALVDATQFDPARSPWDITLVGGLEGDRAALYLRADHVLTDGADGKELVDLLLDPATADAPSGPRPDAETEDAPAPDGQRRPGTVTLTVDLTSLARPVSAGLVAARAIDPVDTVVRGMQRGVEVVSSLSRQLVVPGGALSTLTPSGAMGTHFEVLSVPGARAAAIRHGGSRSVLLVAAVAAGLGAYHELHGRPAAELRLAMPIRIRHSTWSGGNSFAPVRVEVPAVAGPAATHFGVVADRLARARREPVKQVTGPISAAVSLLPSRALRLAVRSQIGTVDFIATTLRGRRELGAICGAAIRASYPFGPRAGRLVNVTALGNADRLDLGISLDPSAVRDPDVLVECIESAFSRLVEEGDQPVAAGR